MVAKVIVRSDATNPIESEPQVSRETQLLQLPPRLDLELA